MSDAFLLSPYRPPTAYPVSLSPDETAAWLAGYFALWHPAILVKCQRPPQPASSYDHDQPAEGAVYCVPSGPHLYQPEDWKYRVQQAGAIAFEATASQETTRRNLLDVLQPEADLPSSLQSSFAGIGYGYLVIETLFDAAEHEHLLDAEGFWHDVQQAAQSALKGGWAESRHHLRDAAEKLRAAREVLNSSPFYLLDWCVLRDDKLGEPWPASLHAGLPLTVLASGEQLERLAGQHPERLAELQARMPVDLPPSVDVVCASYRDREEALLPIESQHWNLSRARETVLKLLGQPPTIAGRQKPAFHPLQPGWFQHHGFQKALMLSHGGATTPNRNSCVVNWPGLDGQSVEAYGREPLPAQEPSTFFNLAYTLHQATTSDSKPTVGFLHAGEPASVGYAELVALSELGEVLGQFYGLSRYFEEYHYGDYLGNAGPDDFSQDDLDERVTNQHCPDAVSGFAVAQRLRRRLDNCYSLASIHRLLTPSSDEELNDLTQLHALEDRCELWAARGPVPEEMLTDLAKIEQSFSQRLAARLQRNATPTPGVLLFNTCAYTRRAAVEIANFPGPIPVADPVKAAQFDDGVARLVVELPPLGFVWLPRTPSGGPPKPRLKHAEGTTVRNEFFEAELDPATGGLRALRDVRGRLNRLGMQLVFNPGSKSVCKSITVTHSGAALGEIVARGELLDEHNQLLATFQHRLRAWAGRPVLEMQLIIEPVHFPTGYPWHAFYGARFGWRDDRTAIFRGCNSVNAMSSATRPVSADYLELRLGSERTMIFTGGLPFWQKNGHRMADLILIPEGEEARCFELLIAPDREYPMQTAQSWLTPTPVVFTDRGPPNGLASSWLGHLDLPSLVMTDLRPTGRGRELLARFIETAGFGGAADLRFAMPVQQAHQIDGRGEIQREIVTIDGAVPIEFSAQETVRLKLNFDAGAAGATA